ncbi:MAG: HYExAFE family protein [Planctomycetota bacterium]|jgi:hypothetical protein
MDVRRTNYERVLESWLIENRVQYLPVDQQKRKVFARSRIKSFDFLLYPACSAPVIAEVKGRKFKGKSLAALARLECWVTMEDIRGLIRWEQVFADGFEAVFIFAYEFENIDVETDGREVYDYQNKRYMFFGVRIEDYRKFMKVRSPKWQTVTLPAEKFRKFAIPARELLVG